MPTSRIARSTRALAARPLPSLARAARAAGPLLSSGVRRWTGRGLGKVRRAISQKFFRLVHGGQLIYNTCWEDPRLDRRALALGPQDNVLVITSAGCNALDYCLVGPAHVYAVDINPRQNALLELKQAGIGTLDYETFFSLFGRGCHPDAKEIYFEQLRDRLGERSRAFWDRKIRWFEPSPRRGTFYFRGTAGTFARLMNFYIDRVARVRPQVEDLLAAKSLDEQRTIYDRMRPAFWKRFVRWALARDATLAMLGVPRAQRLQVEKSRPGGIAKFIENRVETVFTRLPLADNYFWRVYLTGEYTTDCCPEYLTQAGFQKLQAGLGERISTHTCSLADFLARQPVTISRFVLLDHMDWMSENALDLLRSEWSWMLRRASPGARFLWRSGGLSTPFVDELNVRHEGRSLALGDCLRYDRQLADELHAADRVHTYGSFCVADFIDPRHSERSSAH